MKKGYYITAGALFLIVAILHAVRAGLQLSMTIGSYDIPVCLSWVVAGLLAYLSFRGFWRAYSSTLN